MPAETLNCPMCGAPASTESSHCEHCGARLATVSCPSCFGLMFAGAKFCSHCGAAAARAEVAADAPELCPHCRAEITAVLIGKTNVRECAKCEGIWVDTASFQQICADREQQSAVLGMAGPLPTAVSTSDVEDVHYLPCPVCKNLMNRVNFAHCSHVIVDVCGQHGTWFDCDELRRIVEFIRAGGLEKARAREIADLQQERARLQAAQTAGPAPDLDIPVGGKNYDGFDLALSAAGTALKWFMKS